MRAALILAGLSLACVGLSAWPAVDLVDGGIIRGPRDSKRIALEFTGHEYAEGADVVLDVLRARGARASFFLTGDFVRRPEFARVIARIRDEGHYLGPHSDKHLLYCDWTPQKRTLIDQAAFLRDLDDNLRAIEVLGVPRAGIRYWVPAYEQYNPDIVRWSADLGLGLINFTPGTSSNADYTGEADSNFVPSARILTKILDRERSDPDGLNGFLLLLHIGAGPGRRDKMFDHLGELLDELTRRGYTFVRVDTLLGPRS
jgi:peptidoglycan/xylan/chitin deacetylase (PgdA/CDA1 family)